MNNKLNESVTKKKSLEKYKSTRSAAMRRKPGFQRRFDVTEINRSMCTEVIE
jgi:hypothetical protein